MAEDEARRVTEWLEAAPSVLDMVSRLLDEHGRLWEATEAAEHECTRLRQELATVCAENDRLVKERSEIDDRINDSLGKANDVLLRFRASVGAPLVDSSASPVAQAERAAPRVSPAAAPAATRAATPATIPTPVSPPERPVEPGPWRILLVDDDANFRRMMIDYLSDNRGYEVLAAVSGEEALTLLPRFRPHAVLLDLAMPGGGMWAIEEIKRLHPELCVIVVSANDDVNIVRKARALGAADYVTKPFDLDCLDAVLDTCMARDGAPPAFRWSPPVTMAAADERATLPTAAWSMKSYFARA
jgi:DNA-binding NarL/FixJ family response regulator